MNGITHYYTTLSGLVMQESWGNKTLYFIYDDSNQPYALIFSGFSWMFSQKAEAWLK